MHVAAAAGARVLAVFGPTDPVRWAPLCDGLTVVRAPGGDLRAVTAEMVVGKAGELFGDGVSEPAME
jgi:ADP-heptose:LPS heptosyltransferase